MGNVRLLNVTRTINFRWYLLNCRKSPGASSSAWLPQIHVQHRSVCLPIQLLCSVCLMNCTRCFVVFCLLLCTNFTHLRRFILLFIHTLHVYFTGTEAIEWFPQRRVRFPSLVLKVIWIGMLSPSDLTVWRSDVTVVLTLLHGDVKTHI